MTQQPPTHLQLELDKLKACIHCGMCLSACPTYRVSGSEAESPRGRLYLMKGLSDGQFTPGDIGDHLDQCLACHACETVCPSGVQYGTVLLATREDLAKKKPDFFKRFMFKNVLPRHGLLQFGGSLLRLYQHSFLKPLAHGIGFFRLFPALAQKEAMLPAIPQRKPLTVGMIYGNPQDPKVVLLIGCVMDIFYNPIHWATIEVLTTNGYCVEIPDQTCCGALAHHAGETDITRALAQSNIDRMLKNNPEWIVVNSAGCGSSMRDYGHLLADNPEYAEKAKIFAQKTIDVMALLARKPLVAPPKALDKTVTYHAACHLYHVQKVTTEPIAVLAQIPGLTLIPLTDASACCGSAGIYNIEHPDFAEPILQMKIEHLKTAAEQGATTVVTGNPGCLLQIAHGVEEAGLPMSVKHPLEILAEAYRKDPK